MRSKKAKKDSSRVDELQRVFQCNSLDDVTWLCSLSESEIDMLIGLKMLVVQHAKMIGCKKLAQKFDLKMLRALVLVHMETVKGKLRSLVQDLQVSDTFMDSSNLLKADDVNILEEEDIRDCINANSRKRRPWRKPNDENARKSSRAKC